MKFPELDEDKLTELMLLIDEINEADYPEAYNAQLQELTGKPEVTCEDVLEYWTETTLGSRAASLLFPHPQKQNLSERELSAIIRGICECRYCEPVTDYFLEVLEVETGKNNVSDLIFFSETDDISAIQQKILSRDEIP